MRIAYSNALYRVSDVGEPLRFARGVLGARRKVCAWLYLVGLLAIALAALTGS